MSVRPFTDADFPAICRIYLEAKRDELAYEGAALAITPLDQDPVILAAFRESNVFVHAEGEVLGFAAAFGTQLRALFVAGGARGRGVGGTLLKTVLAGHGQALTLHVARSNGRARQFYAAHGFAVVGSATRHYDGRHIAYLTMRRAPA